MGKNDKKMSALCGDTKVVPDSSQKSELSSNSEFLRIVSWLSGVKFKKKAVSGLDPVDVWKKIEELNRLYENALIAERARYDLQLEQIRADAERNSVLGAVDPECDRHG